MNGAVCWATSSKVMAHNSFPGKRRHHPNTIISVDEAIASGFLFLLRRANVRTRAALQSKSNHLIGIGHFLFPVVGKYRYQRRGSIYLSNMLLMIFPSFSSLNSPALLPILNTRRKVSIHSQVPKPGSFLMRMQP